MIMATALVLQACGDGGEKGTINDGFEGAGDANGALQDTSNINNNNALPLQHANNTLPLQHVGFRFAAFQPD